MITVKADYPSVLEDNLIYYIINLIAVIQHADPTSSLLIKQVSDGYAVIVTPSLNSFKQDIIDNLLGLHKRLKIKPIFSKSTKIQSKVYYKIEIPQD